MHERRWLLAAALALVAALLAPWWVVSARGTDFFEAGAYTSASRSLGNVLDGPTILVGILSTTGLLAALGGFAFAHYLHRPDAARALAFVALASALVAALVPPFTWPGQWAKDVEARSTPIEGEEPGAGLDASWWGREGDLRYRPDLGWYALVAAVLLLGPAAAGWPNARGVPSLPPSRP